MIVPPKINVINAPNSVALNTVSRLKKKKATHEERTKTFNRCDQIHHPHLSNRSIIKPILADFIDKFFGIMQNFPVTHQCPGRT